jgi:hypothetical protein
VTASAITVAEARRTPEVARPAIPAVAMSAAATATTLPANRIALVATIVLALVLALAGF